jgi:ZIP family zinc transporter
MGTGETVLLGAIAGFTIFLGLPVGRIRGGRIGLKTFLSGFSAGVLLFLLMEIFLHSFEPVEEALEHAAEGEASWGRFAGMGILFVLGIGIGLISLFYVLRAFKPRASTGPGAMAVAEVDETHLRRREALNLGLGIAVAVGLHNFSEGLAIGQSAAAGDTSLALLLVIGFALHNATEGFGIVGPLAGANAVASWGWLVAAGLIGGGPTFLGTIVGRSFTNEFVSVGFLALAAGAIIYVVGELVAGGRRLGWEATLWGIFAGFVAGVGTELVLVLAES